jgi:hypothetical protein
MRFVLSSYGNDPTNWFVWAPTPGGGNYYNSLPTVALIHPVDNEGIIGPTSIVLSAAASDADDNIVRVEFYEGTNKIGQATTAPFNMEWNNVPFGTYTLTAKARDSKNGSTVSTPITIRVTSRPPVAALTSPVSGAIFIASNLVTLTATASDPDSPVAKVAYYVDGAKVAEAATAPYTAQWMATPGSHQLTAVATDTTGGIGTSAPAGISVQSVAYTETIPVTANSIWKYLDNGTDPGTGWTNLNFPEVGWFSGMAELGYGDTSDGRPEATIISYGPNINSKYISYYFRQTFVLASPADVSSAILRVMRDDGAIAWLNGVEVFRNNMPLGNVDYLTLASGAISGTDEATFYPTNISPSHLVAGPNVLAIEVHQNLSSSSDLSFAAELRVTRQTLGPAIASQPISRVVSVGQSAMFAVSAIGSAPLSYQWYFNGSPMPGQTAAQLALADIQLAQAGGYSVTISNAGGVATSIPAALAVDNSDFDGDGLLDSWEIANGLNPLSSSDRLLDPDGDGMSNYSEFIAGTNPTNAASVLRIDSLSFGRGLMFDFVTDANLVYTVEKTDALGTAPWTPLAELAASPSAQTRRVADGASVGSRFYRLATTQNPATPLRISSFSAASVTKLTFNAVSNRVYAIEYTDALNSGVWIQLVKIPAQPTTRTVTIADPVSTGSRMYRLVIPAP